MPIARARFFCSEMTTMAPLQWGDEPVHRIRYRFTAQYDKTIPTDLRFAQAVPDGEVTITVHNPDIQFAPGGYYYLDFTPVITETKGL